MSVHSSLKVKGTSAQERNVWTRTERLAALAKSGRWKEGDKVVGLPKVRTKFKVKSKKQVKAETPAKEGAAGAAPAAAPGAAAAPAAAAKPAGGKPAAGGKA
ncbi:MAG: small basic protein [Planctomycetes bacterium]|nr:small basic protein [Planctomycetota bacterium]